MMSVLDYANESGKSVKEILVKCKELGIIVNNDTDELDEDSVIILDNEFLNNTTVIDENLEDKYELEDRAENVINSIGIDSTEVTLKKQKIKKKDEKSNKSTKEQFLKNKKEIYKSKEKLQSNKEEKKSNVILYKTNTTVGDLASLLNINSQELVKKLVLMGLMISVGQVISFEDASIVALEYGYELKKEETVDISNFEEYEISDASDDLVLRAPVVTIMGHVDHGKTTLLDYIRHTNVSEGEAGGITQHIGAYQVEQKGRKITFIDTPGHAAFTEMRARGASITDIVIIIVSADDGVMPQTKEAIEHSQAAKVPIIVAINKIDKPGGNVDKIMSDLSALGLTPEEWGGDTPFIKISAKTGLGVNLLLDNIIALAEVLDLKANPSRYAIGTVVEARLDKKTGVIATLLVQNGTLRLGDAVVIGSNAGKVRTLKNDSGSFITEALPSTPVEITGITDTPSAGDKFMAFESEKEAKQIADKRKNIEKSKVHNQKSLTLDELFDHIKEGRKEINIVLKADVKGSEEAVKNSLEKITVESVTVSVIRSGVGAITESDIVLASASNAIIVGFNIMPDASTREIAERYKVEIRTYNIIYKLTEEIESAMKGMLDPKYEEVITGEAEVRKLFKFSKVGVIAGCHITSGIIKSNSQIRLLRDGVITYEGVIGTLQREKDEVKEVKKGFDCGITIKGYSDIKESDIISAYELKEVK